MNHIKRAKRAKQAKKKINILRTISRYNASPKRAKNQSGGQYLTPTID